LMGAFTGRSGGVSNGGDLVFSTQQGHALGLSINLVAADVSQLHLNLCRG
jgi:hypothetical protein